MCNMRVILLGAVVGLSNFVANATDVVTRHDEDTSPFQIYDNNAMVGYYNAVEGNGDSGGGFALNVEPCLIIMCGYLQMEDTYCMLLELLFH
jgi:hypothetical protein